MEKLFIIDASGYLYSSYFAIRNMTNSKGESTNALFGFIRSVLKIIKEQKAEHVVAIFDGANNAKKRKSIYPQYKAHRQSMPEDLGYQIERAQQLCTLIGLPWLSVPEVEADDTMGSIAVWAKAHGIHAYLCSSDKDLCQLVNESVSILNTNKDNLIIGPKEVEEIHGLPPALMVDYLALVGDASDNVPGLPGFGPKTAVKYLSQFGGLDNLLAHPEQITEKKKREIVQQQAQLALLSRELVTIDTQVAFPQDKTFFQRTPMQEEELKAFYREMNFNSLLKELEAQAVAPTAVAGGEYMLVDDERAFESLLEQLSQQKSICIDVLATSNHFLSAELVGIGFGYEPAKAWYVPANGLLGLEYVLAGLAPLFKNPNIAFYSHNLKFHLHVLENYDISPPAIDFDTGIASYLLSAQSRQYSLDALMLQFFNKVKTPLESLVGKGKALLSIKDVALEKACQYCGEEVDYTCRLKAFFEKEIAERKLASLLYELELPLVRVLAQMERNGIYVDRQALDNFSQELKNKISFLREQIYALAGEECNLNSPKQLGEIFQKLGIKSFKKTATGQMRTDSDVLESLSSRYPIAQLLLEYRGLEKLRSTYVEALPAEINAQTGRIHCTFNQVVAATGRLSCQNPNLQNIPVRAEEGRRIREAFRPQQEGFSYLAADYSQIELRLLAHFSQDPHLLEAFNQHQDVHAHTASVLFDCPLSAVTSTLRNQAKTVNFGIIYGQQAFGLSQTLGIDVKSAAAFIDMYFQRYARVQAFVESCKEKARLFGKTFTLIGREREITDILSKNTNLRTAAERLAINTPLQGTAADMIKMAMVHIAKRIQQENLTAKMILQIHDELIFELPDEEILLLKPIVQQAMEEVVKLDVPLIIDIAIGKNWKEC